MPDRLSEIQYHDKYATVDLRMLSMCIIILLMFDEP